MLENHNKRISTEIIVSETMATFLNLNGISWKKSSKINCSDYNLILMTTKRLCSEFDKKNTKIFDNLKMDLPSYNNLLSQIIVDEKEHWGRIIAILCAANNIALLLARRNNNFHEIDVIKDQTTAFIEKKLKNWIDEQDGWYNIVEFF